MVKGLGLFKEHFAAFSEQYVLIGGTACSILLEEADLEFRATKDLDIVLCIEALNAYFVKAFWEFVRAGQYAVQQKSTGEKQFYRFKKPEDSRYPFMLELFSRKPDLLSIADGGELTPIPLDEDLSSLSAILLNDDYYQFIKSGIVQFDGLPLIPAEYLIPLKAIAWLDLSQRKLAGEAIDSTDVNKHKNDIFRLFQLVIPSRNITLPTQIYTDMQRFMQRIEAEPEVNTKQLKIGAKAADILAVLKSIYSLA
jgi:hypothetical protein